MTNAADTNHDLYDYDTAEIIRLATADEVAASIEAAKRDGGAGVIDVDGRSCYVIAEGDVTPTDHDTAEIVALFDTTVAEINEAMASIGLRLIDLDEGGSTWSWQEIEGSIIDRRSPTFDRRSEAYEWAIDLLRQSGASF